MPGNPNGVVFVIHSFDHLRAALAAGAANGSAIVALSGPSASAYAGPSWFLALAAAGAEAYPQVKLTAVLDCGDRAGDALAALELGAPYLVFTGHPDAAARLHTIAEQKGAAIFDRRPPALDLLYSENPDYAARAWCAGLPVPGPFGY